MAPDAVSRGMNPLSPHTNAIQGAIPSVEALNVGFRPLPQTTRFCRLPGFELLPRLKTIRSQKLYRPDTGRANDYLRLQRVLTRPINWELVRQHYDQMVRYATALRLGIAETEAIVRRFTRKNVLTRRSPSSARRSKPYFCADT